MNILKDVHRGENQRRANSRKHRTRTWCEDLCVDGLFKRCNVNPMNLCVKRRVSQRKRRQRALLNTYPPKLIARILKVFVNKSKKTIKIAGPVPGPSIEYKQILRDGEGFWDEVNGGYLPEDLVLARREENAWVHSQGLCEIVPMQEGTDAGKKLLDLTWVDTGKSVDPVHNNIWSRPFVRENKTRFSTPLSFGNCLLSIQRTMRRKQLISPGWLTASAPGHRATS